MHNERLVCMCADERLVCMCADERLVCMCADERLVCMCADERLVCKLCYVHTFILLIIISLMCYTLKLFYFMVFK